ncbi:syntaxin, Qa-SNARE family [Hepatocystis sp. ex Piliocolobus tephrosceles]|nr:syntaxin, Qa-SNARE family [Hepatocystis sp. ex Piliocolobus tephrosceles]
MNDLFDELKSLGLKKNMQNAERMTPLLSFQYDKVIKHNYNKNYNNNNNNSNNDNIKKDVVITINAEHNKNLIEYVDLVDKTKENIKKIYLIINEIYNLKNKINISPTTEEENEISVMLNVQIKRANNIIELIKTDIRNIRSKLSSGSIENRNIKKTIHDNLINIFKKALHNYQQVQNDYNYSVKNKISRHIKIMYPEYTEEDIDNVLNYEDINTQNLVRWKLQGHNDLKNALTDVETKYKDVKTLEKNVCDLHQTIIELSALIEINDEIISNIHENIDDAQQFTEKANADLIEAKNIQRKTSKWTFYISAAILIIIIVICLPIFLKVF